MIDQLQTPAGPFPAWVDACLLAKPGAVSDYKAEWDWQRYQVGGKLFAALCAPGENHALYANRRLLSLKGDPAANEFLRAQYPAILPGFYMDKRCWISIDLDAGLPQELIEKLCDTAYQLVFAKLTKKMQRELTAPETPQPETNGGN